jgi:NAD(P)-dependent dehydrogenase (short-subunit alcohol dehydrogenase family)
MRLEGKVAIVTGGAAGIGRALAERFAAEGARGVVVADIDAEGARTVASGIERDRPGTAFSVGADVAADDELAALIHLSEDRFGRVDVFCANAGIGGAPGLLETTSEDWDRVFAINTRSHVTAARLLVPGWVERGSGWFLATASAAGLLNQIGAPAYAVTKHAAIAFAEWLALTYGDQGVGVSCLCPMAVRTRLLADGLALPGDASLGLRISTGAGAVLEPTDIAQSVIEGLEAERFLILPHPEAHSFETLKVADRDAWLEGMRRVKRGAASLAA